MNHPFPEHTPRVSAHYGQIDVPSPRQLKILHLVVVGLFVLCFLFHAVSVKPVWSQSMGT